MDTKAWPTGANSPRWTNDPFPDGGGRPPEDIEGQQHRHADFELVPPQGDDDSSTFHSFHQAQVPRSGPLWSLWPLWALRKDNNI